MIYDDIPCWWICPSSIPQGPGLENNAINSANPGHNSLGF